MVLFLIVRSDQEINKTLALLAPLRFKKNETRNFNPVPLFTKIRPQGPTLKHGHRRDAKNIE